MPKQSKKTSSKARPMSNPDAEIVILLDRSGSMSSIKSDMVGGFRTFIDDQKKEKGKCTVTLVQFDTQGIEDVYVAMPIDKVPNLILEPRGGTPLLDATGKTIAATRDRLKKFKGNVIFMTITDGLENASSEYKREAVKKMIEEQTKLGWGFLYLAANVDAFAEAQSIGVMSSNAINYTPSTQGVHAMYAVASNSAKQFRSATPDMLKVANISEEDRKKAHEAHTTTSTTPKTP